MSLLLPVSASLEPAVDDDGDGAGAFAGTDCAAAGGDEVAGASEAGPVLSLGAPDGCLMAAV
ncbi:hypothetical protein K377_03431 [Streptomyces sp. PsTaAH-137]|uniref:hypothetical protein n=1 Tax=Streptomyces sp. PsTaAH-137 TaxID=1305830 RepID=UPI000DBACEBF|nr:hypothetical protein [Streptomyces sp. PsTaAH-137]MYT73422.1 hypothetical protein [Streptomyces sp. SID8367]RAJ84950.1 hypothetical protein K377_03431 [Streptomyces sp. PsTaAH-137]